MKTSFLSGDNPFYKNKVDEGFIDFFKSVFEKLKSFFKSFKNSFGTKNTIKIQIPLPLEEVRKENSGSSRKDSGSQVEAFSVFYIGKKFSEMGFVVEYGLNGKNTDSQGIWNYIEHLQSKIDGGIEDAISNNEGNEKKLAALNKKKLMSSKETEKRKEFGIVTAQRLGDEVLANKIYPLIHKVRISSDGQAGTGSTKSDINIDFSSMTKDGFAEILHKMAISHKYNQHIAFGTQTTAYGFPSTLLGMNPGTNAATEKTIEEYSKRMNVSKSEAKDFLDIYKMFIGNKEARQTKKNEYEKVSKKYFEVMSKLVEENYEKIFKMIGVERDVEHFFVNPNRKTKDFSTYYSTNSEIYGTIYKRFYGEEVESKLSAKAIPKEYECVIEFLWDGKSFFKTSIKPIESNTNNIVMISGVSIDDIADTLKKYKF